MPLLNLQNTLTVVAQFSLISAPSGTQSTPQAECPLRRKVSFLIDRSLHLNQEKITQLTKAILQDLAQTPELLEEDEDWSRSVTVRSFNQENGEIDYVSDAKPEVVKHLSGNALPLVHELVELLDVKEFSLYPITKKAEPIGFCEHLFQILNDTPWLYFPVLGWLAALVWAVLAPPVQVDQRLLTPDELAEGQITDGPEAFSDFMQVIGLDAEKQKNQSLEQYVAALNTLQNQALGCAQRGLEIANGLKHTDGNSAAALPVDALARQYCDEIFSKAQQILCIADLHPELEPLYAKAYAPIHFGRSTPETEPLTEQEQQLEEIIEAFREHASSNPNLSKHLLSEEERELWEQALLDGAMDSSRIDEQLFLILAKLALADARLQQEGLDPAEIATIPLGYYRDEKYQPVLLSFCLRNGELIVQTINLDPALGKKVCPVHHYSLTIEDQEDLEQTRESFVQALSVLFQLQQESTPSSSPKEGNALNIYNTINFIGRRGEYNLSKAQADYEAALKIQEYLDANPDDCTDYGKRLVENPMTAFAVRHLHSDAVFRNSSRNVIQEYLNEDLNDYRERLAYFQQMTIRQPQDEKGKSPDPAQLIDLLLKNAGCIYLEPSPAAPQLISSTNDWLKSTWTWMQDHYPALSEVKKLTWETNILFNYIDSFLMQIQNNCSLSCEQQAEHLTAIEKKLEHLKKSYRKEFGSANAFEKIWFKDETTKTIFDDLQSRISASKGGLASRRLETLNLPGPRYSQWTNAIPKQAEPAAAESAMLSQYQPFLESRQLLLDLEQGIQQFTPSADPLQLTEEATQIKIVVDEYTACCTELFEQNRYSDLTNTVSALFDKIPSPNHPFWNAVAEDQLDSWGETIAKLTQYVWESHIKLNRRFIWPHQSIHLCNGRAVLARLIDRQAKYAKRRFSERFEAIPEEERQLLIQDALHFCSTQGGDPSEMLDQLMCLSNNDQDLPRPLSRTSIGIGKIAKEIGMSLQETLLLGLIGFSADLKQASYLLHHHPYLRFGDELEKEIQLLEIEHLHTREPEKDKWKITLDTNDPCEADNSNRWFFEAIISLSQGFACEKCPEDLFNSEEYLKLWSRGWKRTLDGEEHCLPSLSIDLRRHAVFMQSLLHPESTTAKAFSGATERAFWTLDLMNKVIQQEKNQDSETILRKAVETERREYFQSLSRMGHLELAAGFAAEGAAPCVRITDHQNASLEYQPTGPKFVDLRDPLHDACVIGKQHSIPKPFVTSMVGGYDFNDYQVVAAQRERDQRVVFPLTEVTTMVEEKEYPSSDLSPSVNARLRSLVVEGKDGMISINTIYNVFEFIFDYPDLIEVEEIQRVLELAMTRTALLQRMLQTNPEYLATSRIGERLKSAIDYAIRMDRKKSAAFLMHISTLLHKHASYAVQLMPAQNNVYRELFADVQTAFQNGSENFQERIFTLMNARDEMPTYSSLFTIQSPEGMDRGDTLEKDGAALLIEWSCSEALDSETKKLIFTFLLEYYYRSHTEQDSLHSLQANDWVHLFHAYAFLKNVGDDAGNPSLQARLLQWVQEKALPYFEEDVEEGIKQQVLGRYALREGRAILPQWNRVENYVYRTTDGQLTVNIQSGMTQSETSSLSFQTLLPEAVAIDADYRALFGEERPEVSATHSRKGHGEIYEYDFTKNGHPFRIEYNSLTQKVSILQQFTLGTETAYYCYKSQEGKKDTLIDRFGLWQHAEDRLKGIVLLGRPYAWSLEDMICVRLREEESEFAVEHCQMASGKEVYHDADRRYLNLFAFAPPSDTLFLRDPGSNEISEVRFLSKGITLKRLDDGRWQGTNHLAQFHLIQEPARLHELVEMFGEDFNRFILPLESVDPATDVKKSLFLTFPTKMAAENHRGAMEKNLQPDTSLNANTAIHALPITVERGKIGPDDGKMRSTTAGFMNLASQMFVRGRYQEAIRYLGLAQDSPFGAHDEPIFEELIKSIRTHPDESMRGIAFKLKAEAAIRHIESHQIGKAPFKPAEWKFYLDKVLAHVKLFHQYQEKLANGSKGRKNQHLLGEELLLTPEEIAFFDRLVKESMEFLVERSIEEPNTPLKTAAPYHTHPIEEGQLSAFAQQLALCMRAPQQSDRLETAPLYVSKMDFVSKFWAYGKQIIEEGLKTSDWRIQKLHSLILANAPAEDHQAIETARQLLIQLAKINDTADTSRGLIQRMQRYASSCHGDSSRDAEFAVYLEAEENLRDFIAQGISFLPDPDLYRQTQSVIQSLSQSNGLTFCRIIILLIKKLLTHIFSWFGCTTPLKFPHEVYTDITQSLQWIQELNTKMQAIEQIITPDEPAAILQEVQEDYLTTARTIENTLQDTASPLSAEEKTLWSHLLDKLRTENPTQEKVSLMNTLLMCVQMNVPLPSIRYETENARLAHELEAKVMQRAQAGEIAVRFSSPPIFCSEGEDFVQESKDFFTSVAAEYVAPVDPSIKAEQVRYYEALQASMVQFYPDDPSLGQMEYKENERLREGIEEAAQLKKQEILADKGVFLEARTDSLRECLAVYRREKMQQLTGLKELILQHLRENAKKIPSLSYYLQREPIYGAHDIFEKMLDLYQRGKLRPSVELSDQARDIYDDLEGCIDRYLIEAIEQQQLVKASAKLPLLDALKERRHAAFQIRDAALRQRRLEEVKVEWREASKAILDHLEDAARKERYIDHESNTLTNPSFTRKHLVAEYRAEIVCRPYQPEVVSKLVNGKNVLILVDPGYGKTKLVFPETAFIQAEKGKFPVILVIDELIHINRQDMDQSTREMFRLASHTFDFTRNTPKDVSFLIDEYNRLNTAKLTQGYVITSIDRLAALDDEISLINEEMTHKLNALQAHMSTFAGNALFSDPHFQQISTELITLQKQKHWLLKIRGIFQDEDTQYIADEIDDIFNINRNYNYALGNQRPINKTALEGTHYIMETILGAADGPLTSLSHTLMSNEQVNLNPAQIQSYMEEAAKAIYRDSRAFGLSEEEWTDLKSRFSEEEFVAFTTGQYEGVPEGAQRNVIAEVVYDLPNAFDFDQAAWNQIKSRCSKAEFVRFILGESDGTPFLLPAEAQLMRNADLASQCNYKYISLLKRILWKTLPAAILQQKAEVDYGQTSDGYTVVWKKNGKESPGIRFANEYELILYHYLYYASKTPGKDYFQTQWRKQQDSINAGIPSIWRDWYLAAGVDHLPPKERLEAIYERFQDPQISWKQRFALVREDILKEKVRMYSSQVNCNSHDPLSGANISGAAGTINEYALPEASTRDGSVHSRKVLGSTLLLLSSMDGQGMDQEVAVYEDAEQLLLQLAADMTCRFGIDQGASMESVDALTIIEKFRAAGIRRQFLFVHPINRKQWMWNPGDAKPKPYDGTPLHKDCFVYYGPMDCRGTDWVIPPGKGALIVGPATDDDEFVQAAWRPRLLGKGHTLKPYIHSSIQAAHHAALGNPNLDDPISLGALHNDIKRRTLDLKSQNNYKAALKKIHNIVPQTVKKMTFTPYVTNEEEYWNLTADNPLKLHQILSDIAADVELFAATRHLFIQKKEISFDTDLMASKTENTIDYLETQYNVQHELAAQMQASLTNAPAAIRHRLQSISQSLPMPDFIRNIASFPNMHAVRRVEETAASIEQLTGPQGLLSLEKEAFKSAEQIQRHVENLKPQVRVTQGSHLHGTDLTGMQELVQEQQQQQQQEQTTVVHFTKAGKRKPLDRPLVWIDWPAQCRGSRNYTPLHQIMNYIANRGASSLAADYETIFPSVNTIENQDCGFSPHIRFTENFKKLFQESPSKNGQLMGRFIVLQDARTSRRQVILLDQLDYDRGFALDLARQKSTRDSNLNGRAGVYALCQTSLPDALPFMPIDGTRILPEENDAFQEDLVQIEMLAGKIFFQHPSEQAALTRWLGRLSLEQKGNLKKFITKAHKVDSLSQIPQWTSSFLHTLLA